MLISKEKQVATCLSLFFNRRLADVQTRFEEWTVLGKVDIEELVSTHCQTYEDFENNFKMVKLKGQQSFALPSYLLFINRVFINRLLLLASGAESLTSIP